MAKLIGKSVLITGAAAGIGYYMAKLFAKAGCKLILVDIDKVTLEKTAKEISTLGAEVQSYVADVSDRKRAEEIAAMVINRYSNLDILINNAGVGLNAEMINTSLDDWKKLIDVDMWGVLNFTYAFLPYMKKENSGHIVNISSGQAFFRLPTWGAYSAIKACVGVFSEILHFELKKYKIDVTTIYPYLIATGFYKDVKSENFFTKIYLKYMSYLAQSPQRVARICFRSIKCKKRVSLVSFYNWIGLFVVSCPPVAYVVSYISSWALTKEPKKVKTRAPKAQRIKKK